MTSIIARTVPTRRVLPILSLRRSKLALAVQHTFRVRTPPCIGMPNRTFAYNEAETILPGPAHRADSEMTCQQPHSVGFAPIIDMGLVMLAEPIRKYRNRWELSVN